MKRASNIQEVFDALSLHAVSEKVHLPHKMIRERYRVRKYAADSYEDACDELTRYYQYHWQTWMRTSTGLPADYAFAAVRAILDGQQGGFVVAVKNAIRGRQGGLVALVDAIAEAIEKDALERYIRWVIDSMICRLDYEQVIAFARQYLAQYGRYILPGEEMMSEYELAANLDALIRFHVNVVGSFRQMLQ